MRWFVRVMGDDNCYLRQIMLEIFKTCELFSNIESAIYYMQIISVSPGSRPSGYDIINLRHELDCIMSDYETYPKTQAGCVLFLHS